jgi:hypothetical protein
MRSGRPRPDVLVADRMLTRVVAPAYLAPAPDTLSSCGLPRR